MGAEGFQESGIEGILDRARRFPLAAQPRGFSKVSPMKSRTFNAVGYNLTAANGTVLSSTAPFVPALYVGSLKTSFDFGDNVFLLGASVMLRPFDPDVDRHGLQRSWHRLVQRRADLQVPHQFLPKHHLAKRVPGTACHPGISRWPRTGSSTTNPRTRVASTPRSSGDSTSRAGWRVGERFDLLAQNSLTIDGAGQPLGQHAPALHHHARVQPHGILQIPTSVCLRQVSLPRRGAEGCPRSLAPDEHCRRPPRGSFILETTTRPS